MKNKIINTCYFIILLVGVLLTVLPTFLTTENQLIQLSMDIKTIQYITAIGILIIIFNTVLFLFWSSLQKDNIPSN
ncbi:MAG: hypothetical protein J6584_05645 [Lactobacillus sp.]|uniref:hypothetical protein n=1 Tax=Bombilactobacillus bombi TaxID=1303590 RepID=UPI0035E506CF|nr:hypothetical protein [Lactobacillus sp.]